VTKQMRKEKNGNERQLLNRCCREQWKRKKARTMAKRMARKREPK